MLQTSSAGSLLPGAAIEQAPAKPGAHADDSGAFSQEFEKQVKKTDRPDSGKAHASAQKQPADKPEERSSAADAADSAARAEVNERDDAATEEAVTGQEAAMDGNNLPLEVVEPALDEAETVEAPADTAQEPASGTTLSLANAGERRSEVIADVLKGQKPVAVESRQTAPAAMLKPEATAEVAEDVHAEDGFESGAQRLRDVMAQRMLAGNGQGDNGSAGRQGKADLNVLLPSQANAARAAGGFDEALRFSSVTGMPATPLNQPAAATVPVAMTLAVPMQQPGWDQAMGERVVWMARNNLQHAEIQLNPRELGPIEIKISMQKDQANVNFVAHHATTRDALEAAIPRLREMLSEQGLNLGQADVSQHSFGDSGKQAAGANGANGLPGGHGAEVEEELGDETLVSRHVGHVSASGVDYFA